MELRMIITAASLGQGFVMRPSILLRALAVAAACAILAACGSSVTPTPQGPDHSTPVHRYDNPQTPH